MKIRSTINPITLSTGLLSFLSCSGTSEDSPAIGKNPNIIIILADDMGYGDATCYNPESEIPTPNIDSIAYKGIRLTDAYAHPWCVPSRYGLLTGRHPVNSQLNWRERSLIESGQITIGSLLQRNGYYTVMIGKWHLGFDSVNWDNVSPDTPLRGGPTDHGFDYFFGIHASLDIPPYFYIENDSIISPHTPWLPSSQFEGKSGAGSYGDFVMQIDNTVGRVRSILRQTGMEDETLLVFTSDNGPLWYIEDIDKYDHRAAGSLRGMKNDVWEGGHRIPFVAQWPGTIHPNIIRDDIVSFDDILATLAAVTGDSLPERSELDSYNILPVLLDEHLEKPVRNKLLIYDRAIRYDDWKFIDGSGEGRVSKRWVNDSSLLGKDIQGELYNLKKDVSEQNNLYYDRPGKAAKLLDELTKWSKNIRNH